MALDFAQWKAWNFTALELADPNISGPHVDLDGDGLTNFAEFALGTQPDDAITRTRLPEATIEDFGGQDYLVMTYDEWAGAASVTYTVEVGADLISWPGGIVEVGVPIDNGDGTVTRKFRSAKSISNSKREFIRLLMVE